MLAVMTLDQWMPPEPVAEPEPEIPAGIPITFCSTMPEKERDRIEVCVRYVLPFFPELDESLADGLTIGHTDAYAGLADPPAKINLNPYMLSLRTIAHEFTHLVQWNCDSGIPKTEKACDIWTLARSPLLLDIPPYYLELPRIARDNWFAVMLSVHNLAREALERRETGRRTYIKWFETEAAQRFG